MGRTSGRDLQVHVSSIVRHKDASPLRVVLQPQHAAAAGYEVPSVVKGVEADDVSIQQRPQQLLTFRKRSEYLGRWERTVQEDSLRYLVQPPPQQRWKYLQIQPSFARLDQNVQDLVSDSAALEPLLKGTSIRAMM